MRKPRKPKPPVESESSIQARIVSFLEAHGWFVYANRSGKMNALAGRMSGGSAKDNGSPDLFCWRRDRYYSIDSKGGNCLAPLHFCVEVKRKGGKCSEAQLVWAGRFCATGHKLVVATSHEEIEDFLRSQGWL